MFLYIAKNIILMVLKKHKMIRNFFIILAVILSLSFGYYKDSGIEQIKVINELIDKWHKDVAEYKLVEYFDFMDSSFVFLGTAPGERWTKNEFHTFCKPYFDKKSTWNFTPKNRIIYFNNNKTTAWFDEELDTWMEGCRGSGVLVNKYNKWKIVHYNLTVLIENDKIKKFIKLRKK
jgi:hypothetical protein